MYPGLLSRENDSVNSKLTFIITIAYLLGLDNLKFRLCYLAILIKTPKVMWYQNLSSFFKKSS